jgi:hypothetical protein
LFLAFVSFQENQSWFGPHVSLFLSAQRSPIVLPWVAFMLSPSSTPSPPPPSHLLPFFPAEHSNLVLHSHEHSPTNNNDRREGKRVDGWSGLGREWWKRGNAGFPILTSPRRSPVFFLFFLFLQIADCTW